MPCTNMAPVRAARAQQPKITREQQNARRNRRTVGPSDAPGLLTQGRETRGQDTAKEYRPGR